MKNSISNMDRFLKGALVGFLFALVLLGWWGFSVGIGVSGASYIWPYQIVATPIWATGDVFLTLTATVAGVAVWLAGDQKA